MLWSVVVFRSIPLSNFWPLNLAYNRSKCSLYSGERSVPLGALVLVKCDLKDIANSAKIKPHEHFQIPYTVIFSDIYIFRYIRYLLGSLCFTHQHYLALLDASPCTHCSVSEGILPIPTLPLSWCLLLPTNMPYCLVIKIAPTVLIV